MQLRIIIIVSSKLPVTKQSFWSCWLVEVSLDDVYGIAFQFDALILPTQTFIIKYNQYIVRKSDNIDK